MSFIESKGYIHANLRASSVLLFAGNNVKIGGFSVCRRSDDVEACKVSDGQWLSIEYDNDWLYSPSVRSVYPYHRLVPRIPTITQVTFIYL